jgi:mannose/fructose/N-acetylgalactosamine-specific phosphotransferase system component IIC
MAMNIADTYLGTPWNAHVAPGASQMRDVTCVAIRATVFMVTAAHGLYNTASLSLSIVLLHYLCLTNKYK